METFYEIWHDGTGNRIGGEFHALSDVEAALRKMLAVNGPGTVSQLAVYAFHPTGTGDYEPEPVLEGAEFVARHVPHA